MIDVWPEGSVTRSAECEHHPVAAAQTLARERRATELVVGVGVGAGEIHHQVADTVAIHAATVEEAARQ